MDPKTPDPARSMSDAERDSTFGGGLQILKRKRGRPKGSKNKTNRVGDAEGVVSSLSQETATRDAQFFVESCVSIFKAGDDWIKNWLLQRLSLYLRVTEEGRKRLGEFEAKIIANSLTDKDEAHLRRILEGLAFKYDILRKMGPEVALCIFLAQYGLRQFAVVRFVESCKPQIARRNQ